MSVGSTTFSGDFSQFSRAIPSSTEMSLGSVATDSNARKKMNFRALIDPNKRDAMHQAAERDYKALFSNPSAIMNYGDPVIAPLNALTRQLAADSPKVDIPEVHQMMTQLNDELRRLRSKYDVSNSKVAARIRKWSTHGVKMGLLGKARSLIEVLNEERKSLDEQVDLIEGYLIEKKDKLGENATKLTEFYNLTQKEIQNLITMIAIMEEVRDIAAADAAAIVVDDTDPADPMREQRDRIGQFVQQMDNRIIAYKSRFFMAYAMGPQVRNIQDLDIAIALKIDTMIKNVIPAMQQTIAAWRHLVELQQGALMGTTVDNAMNDTLTSFASASAQIIPMVAEISQTPSLRPETVDAWAKSFVTQAEGFRKAIKLGVERREILENSMVDGMRVIQNANAQIVDDEITPYVERAQAHVVPPELLPDGLDETALPVELTPSETEKIPVRRKRTKPVTTSGQA